MQMISGTIKSAVKLDVLLDKWEQKMKYKTERKNLMIQIIKKQWFMLRSELL